MSNTRFRNDDARVIKQLQECTDQGRWILNVPGNGIRPSYMEDIHIRPQKWGGNLMTNSVDLESELRGMTTLLNKGCNEETEYKIPINKSHKMYYPTSKELYTDQMRHVEPAWELRNKKINNWLEPLQSIEKARMIPLQHYRIDTRNGEKDYFDNL